MPYDDVFRSFGQEKAAVLILHRK